MDAYPATATDGSGWSDPVRVVAGVPRTTFGDSNPNGLCNFSLRCVVSPLRRIARPLFLIPYVSGLPFHRFPVTNVHFLRLPTDKKTPLPDYSKKRMQLPHNENELHSKEKKMQSRDDAVFAEKSQPPHPKRPPDETQSVGAHCSQSRSSLCIALTARCAVFWTNRHTNRQRPRANPLPRINSRRISRSVRRPQQPRTWHAKTQEQCRSRSLWRR